MRRLSVYNFITVNGFYKGPNNDISWGKPGGEEEKDYAKQGANSGSTLIFGRVTYEMMSAYWPSEMALKNDPELAKGMNEADKIVFSKTLKKAQWNNTRIISGNLEEEIKKLKQMPGNGMTILGSGNLSAQLSDLGLIDEYQVMVNPVALGDGTPLFKGIHQNLELKLIKTKPFKSGGILLFYEPVKK